MIDIVVVYILTVKVLGAGMALHLLLNKRIHGFWIETVFKYYLMSFVFFLVIFMLTGEQHLDPSMAAVDIIGLCWLWSRSKHGIRGQ